MLSTLARRGWERKKILTDGNDCHFRDCALTKSPLLRKVGPFTRTVAMQHCVIRPLHNNIKMNTADLYCIQPWSNS